MAKTLKVTLIRSTIGAVPKNKATVEAMAASEMDVWHTGHQLMIREPL